MKTSEHGLNMIRAFEGYFAKPYRCPAGVLTQGYGHTAAAGGRALGGHWTKGEAMDILRDDLARLYEPGVRKLLKRQPTQGQFDAMVSFAFNCGVGALARSSILKHFNRGDLEQAAAAFALWVKAGNKTMPGLVRRRASEALAFQGQIDANFDGVWKGIEPVYGAMPQAVEPAREQLSRSRTAQGGVVAAAGTTTVLAGTLAETADRLKDVDSQISAGTWLGIAVGVLTLVALGYALHAKWTDAGRPLPWGKTA